MAATTRHQEFEAADRKLRRELSLQQLFFISFGAIIGSGWLFAVLAASAVAGPAVVLSWVIAGILIIFVALNYAEVACMLPRSGAVVRYPHLSHGGYLGYIVSWAFLVATVSVPSIEAEGVVTYASTYLGGLTAKASGVTVLTGKGLIIAVLLMIFFFFVNYFGVRFFGLFNQILTWWKLIIPVLTFIFLFFVFNGSNFTAYGGAAPLGVNSIFLAIATSGIIFAYLGFRQGLDFGGEAKNPQRDIPLATIMSVIAAAIIYILLQIGFIGALNWHQAGVTPGHWAALAQSKWGDGPLYHALHSSGIALLGGFSSLLLVDAFVSPSGTGWIYIGASTRVLYGMAMQDDLPRPLTRISERYRIPWIALIASLIIGCLFLLPLPSWYLLVGFISSATALTFMMGALQLQVLRRTAPDLPRPFRLKGAAVLSPLGFLSASMIIYWSGFKTLKGVIAAVFVGLCVYTFVHAPNSGWMRRPVGLVLGVVFLVAWVATQYVGPLGTAGGLSFPVFFILCAIEVVGFSLLVWWTSTAEGRRAVNAAWWVLFLILASFLLSYYGAYGPLTKAAIPFPYDNLIAIVIGLISYYWGVASGFETDGIRAINATGTGLIPEAEEQELNLATGH
jgi:amino acid transporter